VENELSYMPEKGHANKNTLSTMYKVLKITEAKKPLGHLLEVESEL